MSAPYAGLMNRYLADVGGSQFFGLLTQYSDFGGAIQNSAQFGGSWTDTSAFPSTPLADANIQNEVLHAISSTGWNALGVDANFYVFTPQGVQSCLSPGVCSDSAGGFCGYHSSFVASNGANIRYSDMPYGGNDPSGCGFTSSPNGDVAADTEISVLSHEQFETVTDPDGTAWYDSIGYEIGDKCQGSYGVLNPGGANLVIDGHPYVVQEEWNNAISDCALSLNGQVPVCSPRPPVSVNATPTADGRLQVTVSATGTDVTLQSIQFQATINALIDIGGSVGVSGNTTTTLSSGTTSETFYVRRANAGAAATVPMQVTDSCGVWPTLVGGGATSF